MRKKVILSLWLTAILISLFVSEKGQTQELNYGEE
jgi:hypothetical protein